MHSKQLTFYTAAYSPYSHRVRLALDEANAKYTTYEFEKRRVKPDWYYQINPLGRIPALTYGGPIVPPDQPSPESAKLAESLPLLEFIAEIYPEAELLPTDPVLRQKARAFISIYENYVHGPFNAALAQGQSADTLLQALEKLQQALAVSGFAVGQYSIADIAVAPFLARIMLFANAGLGTSTKEDGQKLRDALASDRFNRLTQYVHDLQERPSFKKDWDEALQFQLLKSHPRFQHSRSSAEAP